MSDSHDTDALLPTASASRLARWRAGWRVALRMARRDVRRHRGRSLLVVIMVGLPVLLLTAGSTLWFSEDVDAAERLPLQLGRTQGYLVDPLDIALHQLVDPQSSYGTGPDGPMADRPATPVPGYAPGREEAALSRLVGATLHVATFSGGTARMGRTSATVGILGIDPRGVETTLAPRVSLESGRWAAASNEVVVTEAGIAAGLPRTGSFELRTSARPDEVSSRTLVVVGVGTGFTNWSSDEVRPVALVGLPEAEGAMRQWLVERSAPITWAEVQRLNTYGVGVLGRHVVEHPETVTLPPDMTLGGTTNKLFLVLAASFALLLLTSLLAGPAFAVGAARQRHSLALAASNGATRAQLRRTVLGQALVLGALSACVGSAAGVLLGLVATRVVHHVSPTHFFAPAEVSWASVAIVTVAGVVSSVVAALVPSRGLGRLDVVSVLKGQHVSPPLRRRVPVAGAVLAALGVAAVLVASYHPADVWFYVFLGGVLLIVVGALLLVPLVLAVVARFGHLLPLPTRMAAREAGRLRGRATPTVAAILGGAAVLTTVCIGLQADTERAARSYSPMTLAGQALVFGGPSASEPDELARALASVDPDLRALTLERAGGEGPENFVRLASVHPGCSFPQTAPEIAYRDGLTIEGGVLPRCSTVATESSVPGTTLQLVDADEFADFVGLDDEQRRAVAGGAVAVLDPDVASRLPVTTSYAAPAADIMRLRPVDVPTNRGVSTWHRYTLRYDAQGLVESTGERPTLVTMPVVELTHDQWVRAVTTDNGGPGAFLATSAAQRLGISISTGQSIVRRATGITPEQESALRTALQERDPDATVTVERGYVRDDALVVGLVIGVIALIILVATLIATALGQAEAAPLLGTLAAVGATRRTRRALAASQALYLALLGAVLGLVAGLAPGIAVSRILTASYTDTGMDFSTVIISIPWLQILSPVLLVPLVAGALAWVSIRQAPTVVRRTA
ncbi:FtsX-like permease family protein [Terrabacter sp. 2RAF25]|uniref:FtsX-like permease family protein n=1 Tax=Terrabacter sp. 2RAF25 TaxID=3232998 RepID=UPI003F9BCDD6